MSDTLPGMDALPTRAPEVVTRPSGRVYRARKLPEVIEVYDIHEEPSLAVIRTHDIPLAIRMAQEASWVEGEYYPDAAHARLSWWRLGYIDGEPRWIDDQARGIPVVVLS